MQTDNATSSQWAQPERYLWALAGVWSLVILGSLAYNVLQVRQGVVGNAVLQARVSFDKDVIYRDWCASHGGVYVPVDKETPPNRYLRRLPERDVVTPSGKRLTLMNPAYMTRQVHALALRKYGLRAHVTSLKLIRPENAPDPWERKALQAFERGEREVRSVEKLAGADFLRLMRPLVTDRPCLRCHAVQGYRRGDVRGGISVSVPMAPMRAVAKHSLLALSVGHLLVWLTALVGLFAGGQRLRRKERERQRAQEELRAAHQELAHTNSELLQLTLELEDRVAERTAAVQARTEEVTTLSEQLLQATKLATMGELAASIAHELNNPLATVSLHVEGLLEDAPEGDPGRRSLEVIAQELDRMGNLVANLLQFSRRTAPQISTVDVSQEISNTLELVHYRLRNDAIECVQEFAPDVPAVQADRSQLRQLFLNLISNAVDAMRDRGGGTLTIRTSGEWQGASDEPQEGASAVTRHPSLVTIAISDTGVGIAPEDLDRIMEPFFTTKPEGKGTGLGMAICKRIVEEHGGTLQVESELGKGTTVRIVLPVTNAANGKYLEDE